MAGGFNSKSDPKNKTGKKSFFTNEISGYSSSKSPDNNFTGGFRGILKPGEKIGLNSKPEYIDWKKNILNLNYLQQQETVVLDKKQQDLRKNIEELRQEIQKLIITTKNLDKEITDFSLDSVAEYNEYQLTVVQRIKKIVVNFIQNVSEAGIWLQSFNSKRRKRNAFWGNVNNKKSGGEQYLFSSEHSAARSAS